MTGPAVAISVFGVIFLAEIPDKTSLAAIVLATRHKPVPVFLGAASALSVQSLVAVGAGQLLSLLPVRPVHIGAGLLFLVTSVVMWRRHEESEEAVDAAPQGGFWRSFSLVFGVIFLAEWGDLTQLATAALAARYAAPVSVFVGATTALWAVVAIAVFVGNRARRFLSPHLIQRVAAVLFAAIGVALLVGLL